MNFYIADCHFGHKNILHFDNRPFADLEQMEEVMVMLWNASVRKGDCVYILGDFCWGKADEWLRLVKQLNGQKVLIEGNHDLGQYPAELKNQFADIAPFKEIVDNGRDNSGRKVLLSHYPQMFYKHANNPKYYMLCGHVHTTAENDLLEKWTKELRDAYRSGFGTHAANCGQIYNVGCMLPWMQYCPRTLDEIIKRWDEHHQVSLE
jgi:calcineurin-like phosphoesterase family protein